jgi:hypothetical protein
MKSPSAKDASVHRESDCRKVGFTHQCCDQRRQQVFRERGHYRRERAANDHTNRHINYVAA